MAYVTEQNLTDIVLDRWQQIPDPRMRQIMQAAIKHLHAFVREVEPTGQEWFTTIDLLLCPVMPCPAFPHATDAPFDARTVEIAGEARPHF